MNRVSCQPRTALGVSGYDRDDSGHTIQLPTGTDMTKLLAAIIAALFAVATVAPVAYAADDTKTEKSDKKSDKKKKGDKEEAKK
jgi:ribosomal protein L12E/L44/L45/RPP1/RPP2